MNRKFWKRGKALTATIGLGAILFAGCGGSRENFVFTDTQAVAPIILPTAVDDNFASLGNATLNRTAGNGVLTNDTVNGATISSFDAVGSQGGAIVLNDDGSFSYTPVFGFVGAETFTYTLENSQGTSTATVTLTSTGEGFFVDNTAPNGGNGSQASPFNTLAAALAAASAGDTVFVARGDGTNAGQDGTINLPTGVNLVGEGSGLILAQTIVPAGQPPILQGPIICGGDNTIDGLTLTGSANESIRIENVGNVTVNNVTSDGPTEEHFDIDNATGTISITDCDLVDSPSDNIDIEQQDSGATFVVTGNTFTNTSGTDPGNGVGFGSSGGAADFNFTFSNNTITSIDTTDTFSEGFEVDTDHASGTFTFTIDNNTMTRTSTDGISIDSDDGVTLTGSITNNTIVDERNDDAIDVQGSGGTVTISGNNIQNPSSNGIELDVDAQGCTFIVDNNEISDSSQDAISFSQDASDGDVSMAIRNNTTTTTTSDSIFIAQSSVTANFCAVISGNQLDADIDINEDGTGDFEIELFGDAMGDQLSTNNNNATVDPSGTITSVAAGTCGF